jgi:hypothetical protein
VVSRISMKVASITAMVTIQGFTGAGAELDMSGHGQCRKSAPRQSVTADTKRSFGNALVNGPALAKTRLERGTQQEMERHHPLAPRTPTLFVAPHSRIGE